MGALRLLVQCSLSFAATTPLYCRQRGGELITHWLLSSRISCPRSYSSSSTISATGTPTEQGELHHLNPRPDDYGRQLFADKCRLKLQSGSGGHGCVSFLREKFIAAGPPNGGDGGSGGSIYIQAVAGETSLHKLARQPLFKAGRGRNGKGKGKGGQRGEDVIIQVPVGTVVTEVSRVDLTELKKSSDLAAQDGGRYFEHPNKWILHPQASGNEAIYGEISRLPRAIHARRSTLQPTAPICLDLLKPMDEPQLLVAGALGGLGNPHFVTSSVPRPKYATRGDTGMRVVVDLELKLLADLGFVGLPNAGKSTLLRALSRSRARVGHWAFTTLQPNIGTVVLDDYHGRPKMYAADDKGQQLTQISVADIPGILPEAHLDRGLGLEFLRHIERARVLAFVIDLSHNDAVESLKILWQELSAFQQDKFDSTSAHSDTEVIDWQKFGNNYSNESEDRLDAITAGKSSRSLAPNPMNATRISSKPWFVVGTKSDIEGTQANYERLRQYLCSVENGELEHPAGIQSHWHGKLDLIPVSAIRNHGVKAIPEHTVRLLGMPTT